MRISMSDPSAPTHLQPAIGLRSGNRALSVMDQIREAILGGAIGAGERLNEVRLSKTLAVSRTPVRAALQALAGEGLLGAAPPATAASPKFAGSAPRGGWRRAATSWLSSIATFAAVTTITIGFMKQSWPENRGGGGRCWAARFAGGRRW